ncbi:MAG: type II toxin-antitoxin system VapC family toxin [Deltaproteobacteria bacterium]|nr:type II toxin-antitoxin system VapC family toxin [Deltaproteobacteria bacterium]
MICYLDSSVVLRKLLRESHALPQWRQIRKGFASRLLRLECLRTIERLRFRGVLSNEDTVKIRKAFFSLLDTIALLPLTEKIIQRAEQPFASPVGSLDGLHLATALLWQETRGESFFLATHDQELAQAAHAHGLNVLGI